MYKGMCGGGERKVVEEEELRVVVCVWQAGVPERGGREAVGGRICCGKVW